MRRNLVRLAISSFRFRRGSTRNGGLALCILDKKQRGGELAVAKGWISLRGMLRWMLVFLLSTSCALDWNVGTGAALDAAVRDTAIDQEAHETGRPSETGAPDAAAPSCSQLQANVDAAKVAAKECSSMPDDCMSHVEDQCGCTVFVAESSSAATSQYLAAIAALEKSGCPIECATCPTPAKQSLCLASAGLKTACNP
jgi:hypothetical protein